MDTDGLLYQPNLKVGFDELQWLQQENDRRAREARIASMLTYGLVLGRYPDGSLEGQWTLSDDDDDGSVTISIASTLGARPVYAMMVDADGYVGIVDVDVEEIIQLPNDNTWHTITARLTGSQREPGRGILLTAGSATIIGYDTHFTRYSGKTSSGFGRGTLIRIDAADSAGGNEGTYEVDEVISDTEMNLVDAIPGTTESVTVWTVAGSFLGATPAEPDIHQHRRVIIERQTGIQREPAVGTVPLYDVKRNDLGTPKVQFIDRRTQRMYRTAVPEGLRTASVTALHVQHTYDLSGGPPFSPTLKYGVAAIGATNVLANALCPCGGAAGEQNRTLLAYEDGGSIIFGRDDDPTHFTGVFIPTGATFAGAQPSLARLPPGSSFTHICAYVEGGLLKVRRTTNAGDTWSAAITVLDPTATDPADLCKWPSIIRLINGRLCLAVEYYDDSAGHSFVVACLSDNHGTTWDTNSSAGYEVVHVTTPGARDAGRPSLGQSADGMIWCAYTVDDTDIGIVHSAEPLGDFSDMGLTNNTANIVIERGTLFDNVNSPALWVSPDGQPIVLYHGYRSGSTSSYLLYAAIGHQAGETYVLDQHQLLLNDVALGAVQDLGIAVCQDNGGPLTVAWVYTPSTPADTYAMKLLPASMPIQVGGSNRYRVV